MDELKPIPIPFRNRWREFRLQVLPLLVFAGSLAAAVVVWKHHLAAPSLQGEVESRRASVTSPQAGVLQQLKVARFQRVRRGEPIAVISPTDPRAPLSFLQTEADLLRARLEPRMTQQRNATDYERLRLEWLLQKVELASARVQLTRVENELKRNEELFKAKLISEQVYDLSSKTKEQLEVEIAERNKAVGDLDQGLQRLAALGDSHTNSPVTEAMTSAWRAQETKLNNLASQLGPITLNAPMDGMICAVYRQTGEQVMDGEPIVTIAALEADRIVGYLRQPFAIDPQVGMAVEIRTRAARPQMGLGEILQVGAHLEPITNSLAMIRPGALVDMGLPIAISFPAGLNSRPGELVDLFILPVQQP